MTLSIGTDRQRDYRAEVTAAGVEADEILSDGARRAADHSSPATTRSTTSPTASGSKWSPQ